MNARTDNWPPGDAEMARRIREYDWATTPLGPIDAWPDRLRAAVEICLGLQFPAALFWGPEMTVLHNDAHIPVLGNRYPGALGRPAIAVFTDSWPALQKPVSEVLATGESVAIPNLVIAFDRGRGPWQAYLSVSFSPVRDEAGRPAGVLINAVETREQVRALEALKRNEDRQAFLLALHDTLRPLADPVEIQRTAMRMLGEWFGALRALYADIDADGDGVTTTEGVENSPFPIPIRHRVSDFAPWMVAAFAAGETLFVEDVDTDPRIDSAGQAAYHALGTGSAAAVPLVKGGRMVAAVIVNHAHPREWAPDDVRLLEDVAEHTWAAVERARAEDALRQSEERYRTLFDAIDQGFCTIEVIFDDAGRAHDYRFLEVNPAFPRVSGLDDAAGKRMRSLAPELEEYWFEIYGRVTREQESVRFEAEAAALGRWYNVYAYPIGTPDDHRVAILFEDITERRETYAALRTSEERFRAILDEATDYAIYTTDAAGQIEDWFPGAASIFGWTAEEASGMPFADTFCLDDRLAGIPERELTAARLHGSTPEARWHQDKHGSRVYIEGVARARYGLDGEFLGLMKIGRDATAQRLTELEQTEDEERRRHDLEAKVASATAELRALSRRLLTVQEEERRFLARELHDEIGQILTGLALTLSAGDHARDLVEAQRIVRELTDKVRQLSTDLRPAALDAFGLLPAVRGHLERYETRTGIMIELRDEGVDRRLPAPVEIAAYRVIQEALTNLARHAGARAGVVQLIADDDTLFVSIRDGGSGFDPVAIIEGTGIGGMRERVELLGGHFEIETAPGQGATITAEIPLGPVAPAISIEPAPGEVLE